MPIVLLLCRTEAKLPGVKRAWYVLVGSMVGSSAERLSQRETWIRRPIRIGVHSRGNDARRGALFTFRCLCRIDI